MAADSALTKRASSCFTFREEGRHIIAVYTPDPEAEAATTKDIKNMISSNGFGSAVIKEDAIEQLARMHVAVPDPIEVVVAERQDGEVKIDVSRNRMQAMMSISRPLGGRPVSLETVKGELSANGIVFGIKQDAIEKAVEAGCAEAVLIAEGSLPTNGTDCSFVLLYDEHNENRPKLDAMGRADMHELEHFVVVKKGDPLMQHVPATKGAAGANVFATELPAKPGREQSFAPKLSGSEVASYNHNLVVASVGGMPQKIERGVNVKPMLQVSSVDITTGNLHFEGTVTVSGDVVAGTTVSATEDIFVSGTVEGASLIAGRDIQVSQGIIGRVELRCEDGSVSTRATRVVSGGSLTAQFIEKAYVEAGHDITVGSLIMHSEVQAGHNLIVGNEHSPKGHILNSDIRAGEMIQAKVLGSQSEIPTRLEVGIGTVSHDEAEKVHQKLLALLDAKKQLFNLIRHLKSENKPENATTLTSARERLSQAHECIKTQSRLYREARNSEQCRINARVVVQSKVYKGVHLQVCGTPHSIGDELAGGVFTLSDNQIRFVSSQ